MPAAGPSAAAAERSAAGPVPAYRLKRSVDCFPASDGAVYLLRAGDDDLTVTEPSERDRLVLELLSKGFVSKAALADACRQRGVSVDGVEAALADLEAAGVLEPAPDATMLSSSDRDRYDRQLIYFADLAPPQTAAEELQRRLASATVVVLGTGGLGSWAACGLACAGIGSLVLIDDDRVELSNLNRQLLFGERDLGALKVEAAARAHCAGTTPA
jgi:ThiF family